MKYNITDLYMVNMKFFYQLQMIISVFAWSCFYEFVVGLPSLTVPLCQFLNLICCYFVTERYIRFKKVENQQKEYFEKKRFKDWE